MLIVNNGPAGSWVLRTFNFYLKQNQAMPPWAGNSIQAKGREWLTSVLAIPTSFTCGALPLPAPFNCIGHEGSSICILAYTYFWHHLKVKRQSEGKCATTLLALPMMPPTLAEPRLPETLCFSREIRVRCKTSTHFRSCVLCFNIPPPPPALSAPGE